MQTYTLLAPAKINLYLEIIGDRPDGFHELAMILQSIDLADRLTLRANGTDRIQVLCSNAEVPLDQTNLAYQAAALMADQFPNSFQRFGGVEITLEKNIPIGAGLAGGSADAAAVLVGIDLLWNLGLTRVELQELAAKLGSDIPFCVTGGTAIATGRGEQLAPLSSPNPLYAVLAKYRDLPVSTVWAYQTYRKQFQHTYAPDRETLLGRRKSVHSGELVQAICHHDSQRIGQLLHNDLEKVVLPAYPAVAELRAILEELGTLGVMMSGSGSTVFALLDSQAEADRVKQRLRDRRPEPNLEIWTTRLISQGIQVLA
ncbi:4-(cytidine 5'-diphospho)-2-C-methyl-D-erythritol kinase [Leptolyngbya ohadii]|uniref:4-(cytidine 5'-diphospho)-2-C-methyl-D-erythritol kinase n=1 Tax=Leptolyngbya ohadii TaxID=1962290 RepID=UPI000B5A01E4|nr:4-(cytidine 5'-diphospho)-2-C-methyl-D-erythritol kinase [Leptolyngbya ohadii]